MEKTRKRNVDQSETEKKKFFFLFEIFFDKTLVVGCECGRLEVGRLEGGRLG